MRCHDGRAIGGPEFADDKRKGTPFSLGLRSRQSSARFPHIPTLALRRLVLDTGNVLTTVIDGDGCGRRETKADTSSFRSGATGQHMAQEA